MEVAIMKKVATIISLTALLLTTGCAKAETPQEQYQKKAAGQMEQLQKNIDQLKDTYNHKLAEMHQLFNEQMKKAQKQFEESMADLKKKQAAAKKELAELQKASGAAWDKAKAKMDQATADLEKAYDKAKSQFK
jgi:TolA-binding protein